jgi:hypothetical protein
MPGAQMGLIGAKAHIARLKFLTGPVMTKEVGKALFVGGQRIAVEAQLSITRGAVSGKNHVASKPGEAPNNDSGDLADKIETAQIGPLKVEVSSNSDHADIEWGNSKVEERPYMRPARDLKRKEVTELVRDAVARVVKKSGRK